MKCAKIVKTQALGFSHFSLIETAYWLKRLLYVYMFKNDDFISGSCQKWKDPWFHVHANEAVHAL